MAKPIKFMLPMGVQIPDGKKPGDTFQLMATFELIDAQGNVELEEVEGEPLDDKEKENEAASPQDDVTSGSPSMFQSMMGGPQ